MKPLPSSWHSNVTGASFALNVKVAFVALVGSLGPESIEVSGALSIVTVRVAESSAVAGGVQHARGDGVVPVGRLVVPGERVGPGPVEPGPMNVDGVHGGPAQ